MDEPFEGDSRSELNGLLGVFDTKFDPLLNYIVVKVEQIVLRNWILAGLHEVSKGYVWISSHKLRDVRQHGILTFDQFVAHVVGVTCKVCGLDLIHNARVHGHDVHHDLGLVIHDLEALVDSAYHVDVPSAGEGIHQILAF
jgi:hypothetical protein